MVTEDILKHCGTTFELFFLPFTDESEEEETQPQETAYHYLASFFYPLFTYSDMKPESWVYVVAISLNHAVFPNVSVKFLHCSLLPAKLVLCMLTLRLFHLYISVYCTFK